MECTKRGECDVNVPLQHAHTHTHRLYNVPGKNRFMCPCLDVLGKPVSWWQEFNLKIAMGNIFIFTSLIWPWIAICVWEIKVASPSASTQLLIPGIHWFFQACPFSSHPTAARFLHHPLPVCLSSCRDTLLPELGYLHSSIMTLSINRHCAKSEANVCKQQHTLCGCVRGQKWNIKTVFQMKWNWDFSLRWNQEHRVMENFF